MCYFSFMCFRYFGMMNHLAISFNGQYGISRMNSIELLLYLLAERFLGLSQLIT